MARQGTKRWWIILAIVLVVATCVAAVALARGRDAPSFSRSIYIYDICFADARHGWMVGERRADDRSFLSTVVFATTDGGDTWKRHDTGTKYRLWDVDFANANAGWVLGFDGIVLHTVDGVHTWQLQDSGTTADLGAATFVSSSRGWIAAHHYRHTETDYVFTGTSILTDDGGDTWRR